MMFDGNWCKLIFTIFSVCYIILTITLRVWASLIPLFISETLRYGKVNQEPSKTFIDFPKSYFKHFYVLAAFVYAPIALYQTCLAYVLEHEVAEWFLNILIICCGPNRNATVSATHTFIAVLLMSLQVWRRYYDTHFVSVFSKNARMNLFHYIPGLVFYMGAFMIMLNEAPKFAGTNKLQSSNLQFSDVSFFDVTAIIVFLWAWYHQHTTTVILANLRKNKNGNVENEGYKIPQGDWFKYLSSPHCSTEILMYTCIWVILGVKHSWWSVYLLVLSNQVDSIISSHSWYQNRFKNFPKERKALIPFVL